MHYNIDIADQYKDQLPYLLVYSIGGMNAMLIKWIEGGMRVSSSTLILCLRESFRSEMQLLSELMHKPMCKSKIVTVSQKFVS